MKINDLFLTTTKSANQVTQMWDDSVGDGQLEPNWDFNVNADKQKYGCFDICVEVQLTNSDWANMSTVTKAFDPSIV